MITEHLYAIITIYTIPSFRMCFEAVIIQLGNKLLRKMKKNKDI